MKIVNLSPEAIHHLAAAATGALDGRRLRISVSTNNDGENYVCFKLGEGMWSAPYFDQPDPYRS